MKLAVISSFLSKTKDRFHEYNEVRTLEEKFAMAAKIPGCEGLEIVYPYEVSKVDETKALLAKYKLGTAAVNVNVKAEPEFRNGGLTSEDPSVRAKAVRFIKEAKDFAEGVGADKVTCCPLGDGYEFAFQYDYARSWNYLVEAFKEAGAYKPNIKLFLEYKPSETRGTCFLNSAGKTLYMLKQIGNKNIGVTLDFGHSMYGGENPAEAAALVLESGFPLYVHINDNDGKWDWDYFCGTKHYLEYVEFMYYLKKYGYDDWLTSDTSPTRWDIVGTFEANARLTTKILKLLDRIDLKELSSRAGTADYLTTWKFIERELFGLKD
jgi:xylose isomerase